jgi:hypothetical protein
MTKYSWSCCASVCSNYIVIGGYNKVIILDFDLNEICAYEIKDNIKKIVAGRGKVITLSYKYLSTYNADNFNCIDYEEYDNRNGVIAYLDSD